MGREILFRGKRVDNGQLVEGFYVKHGSRHWIYTGEIQYMYLPVCADLPTKYEVEPESIGQYTGLTDKNGRKIFEGDIVKRELMQGSAVGQVVWFDVGFCGFYLKRGNSYYPIGKEEHSGIDDCDKVIGNIFDTPHLLKE